MKKFVNRMNNVLEILGYRKTGNSFWKVDDGFYKLINFQEGAYGGGYFFVNIGLHLVGFPELLTNKLSVVDQPKESECIFRLRVEQISGTEQIFAFRRGLVSFEDEQIFQALAHAFLNDVEQWFKKWGSYENIANASQEEILQMINVVPVLRQKAYFLLKSYCLLRLGDKDQANAIFKRYQREQVNGLDFSRVDYYDKVLLSRLSEKPLTSQIF